VRATPCHQRDSRLSSGSPEVGSDRGPAATRIPWNGSYEDLRPSRRVSMPLIECLHGSTRSSVPGDPGTSPLVLGEHRLRS
jgi:hypothetical protein